MCNVVALKTKRMPSFFQSTVCFLLSNRFLLGNVAVSAL